MPNTKVIDLSESNTIPENLRYARNAGVVGMIHQASEGIDEVDEKAEARVYLAKDAGMLIGLYHVLTTDRIGDQVEHFMETATELGLKDNWLLAVQYNDPSIDPDDVAEFLKQLERDTSRKPVLYSGPDVATKLESEGNKQLSSFPLWVAQYEPVLDIPTAWGKYFLWQFTDDGEVEGVDSPVNCSESPLDDERLAKEWSGFKGKTDTSLPPATPIEQGEPESGTAPAEPEGTGEGELEHATPEAPPPTDGHEGEAEPPPSSQLPADPKPPGKPEHY